MEVSQLPSGWLVVFWFGVLGLCLGSFVNVVCYRLPIIRKLGPEFADGQRLEELSSKHGKFSLSSPRSACPGCGSAIKAKHNIPVVSWVMLRGKCSACHAPISWKYPAVELLFGVTFAAYVWLEGLWLAGLLSLPMMAIAFCGLWIKRSTQQVVTPLVVAFAACFAAQMVLTGLGFSAYVQ